MYRLTPRHGIKYSATSMWGIEIRRLAVALLALPLIACSSYTPPRPSPNLNREIRLPLDAETAWRRVIRYFSDHNVPIENMDHSSFFIKTKAVDLATTFAGLDLGITGEIPIKNTWCDCGAAQLGNVWSSTSRIRLSFSIMLEADGTGASVIRVNTFFEGVKLGRRNLYASGYDIEMPLTCLSSGRLESDIVAFIQDGSPLQ